MNSGIVGDEEILLRHEGSVATLVINRPHVRNALTLAALGMLAAHVERLAAEGRCRVIMLTGAGDRAFAAGADLAEMRARVRDATSALAYDTEADASLRRIAASPLPLVAVINGAAIGTGCLLLQCCDLRVAADAAWIGIPAARLSILVPLPDIVRLAEAIGPTCAADLLLTGRLLSAHEARAIGLVNHVVPSSHLHAFAADVARQIAQNAPLAVREMKRLLRTAGAQAWPLPEEARESYEAVYRSAGFQEALAALGEERSPRYPDE